MSNVRVRFAPSPTGGLHLGGVRTVLFNYLFARKHNGKFILRIEDTDQKRYVEGAEQYILDCLQWCGLEPDESVRHGGEYGPYRQSERKDLYKKYADQLVTQGNAYYGFDTTEEIEAMREKLKSRGSDSLQYDHRSRRMMRNSLNMQPDQIQSLIAAGTPYVIRFKTEPGEAVRFTDLIRGELVLDADHVDDKVLLKADGMPTYHLAVVVDDYLMKITHAFRGEEWLPSAPVHLLLWKHLFGLKNMPQWAHLPLILKPDGNGKLSKRDGDRLGFPVYAMDWRDPQTGDVTKGFKELGFLPEAFLNLLVMLGWNDGTGKEIFTLDEMIEAFSPERVHKAGAKFDFEKAKWFNQEWIKKSTAEDLAILVAKELVAAGVKVKDDKYLIDVIRLVKERCVTIPDFKEQSEYFFGTPPISDTTVFENKWSPEKTIFFKIFAAQLASVSEWNASSVEAGFKLLAAEKNIKPGELQLPLRIMLVGGKFGPGVFEIANLLGKAETLERINRSFQFMSA